MVRAPRFETTGLKKGAWSLEEDRKLTVYVNKYGIWNWRAMPKYAGLLRCGKSCRLRWMNYLRPDIRHGNFSKEEDETILKLHNTMGNKWSAIAAKLPGRTDNEIKNHWHTCLKKHLKNNPELKIESEPEKAFSSATDLPLSSPEEVLKSEDSMDTRKSPCLSIDDYSLSSIDSTICNHDILAMEINVMSSLEAFGELGSFSAQPVAVDNWYLENVESVYVGPAYALSPYECYIDSCSDFWSNL